MLPQSILKQAVEGRLVSQDPADEPASALLECIREKRAELVKQKKVKAPKGGESRIFQGADGSWYEQRGKTAPVCIDEEIPFDIPESWEWSRLGSLGEIVGGGTPKTGVPAYWSDAEKGVPWITPADMKNVANEVVSRGKRFISQLGLAESSARILPAGSVVMSSRAPIGYIAIAERPLVTNQGFKSVVPVDMNMNIWVKEAIKARMYDIKSRASGTTFDEISGSEFEKTVVPVPPVEEQQRIVEKVDEILGLLNVRAA